MNIAKKILKQQEHDNTTLDRVVSDSRYQEHVPIEIIKSLSKTTYVYGDGSRLINYNDKNWPARSNNWRARSK